MNNYSLIHNDFLERIVKVKPAEAGQVAAYLWRSIVGHRDTRNNNKLKFEGRVSIEVIQKWTGLSTQAACDCLETLQSEGMIEVEHTECKKGKKTMNLIKIHPDYHLVD